jgi:hypothetical protein
MTGPNRPFSQHFLGNSDTHDLCGVPLDSVLRRSLENKAGAN